jgi:SpoIID/LytB domain protein
MCQCGAEGMARKGKSTEEILSYYYPGAKIEKLY